MVERAISERGDREADEFVSIYGDHEEEVLVLNDIGRPCEDFVGVRMPLRLECDLKQGSHPRPLESVRVLYAHDSQPRSTHAAPFEP